MTAIVAAGMPRQIWISMLGGFGVTIDGQPVAARQWRRRHAAALIKILALTPGRSMHRERVIDTLWPDLDVVAASPRLHKAAHYARRALGDPDSVVLGGHMVSLYPDAKLEVDALRFQSSAQSALDQRDPWQAADAADQYRAELLPGDCYEPWSDEPREQLRLLHLDVLRLAGRWQSLVAADPTNEEAHLAVIGAFARAGDNAAALRRFDQLERALSRELDISPSREAISVRDQLAERCARSTMGEESIRLCCGVRSPATY